MQEGYDKISSVRYAGKFSYMLEVPSAIISSENNFIINTMHEDFKKVKISGREPFNFDRRLRR